MYVRFIGIILESLLCPFRTYNLKGNEIHTYAYAYEGSFEGSLYGVSQRAGVVSR